jgi:single-strand DNA-binding protein
MGPTRRDGTARHRQRRTGADTVRTLEPLRQPYGYTRAMALEVTGKLHQIFDMQQVTDKFSKRELVLELGGKYPQLVLFQLTGKRCGDIDGYQVGDTLRVEFALRGREWKNRQGEIKFFNSLDVLKLDRAEGAPSKSGSAPEADDSIIPF